VFLSADMLDEPYKPGNPVYDGLREFADGFAEKFMSKYEPFDDSFFISHGDINTNNILFRLNGVSRTR